MTVAEVDQLYRAQFGEDRVLWQVFRQRRSGFFIEVGAYDGVALSNTFFLEQMGWHGILVEPIQPLCAKAAQARPNSRVVHAACSRRGDQGTGKFTVTAGVPVLSFLKADASHVERCRREGATLVEIEVPVVTLDDILLYERKHGQQHHQNPLPYGRGSETNPLPHSRSSEMNPLPHGRGSVQVWQPNVGWRIDLVSIDVEGGELDVLDGFNLDRFKPRILVLENERESGEGIEPYLTRRGYRKFHRQVINDFYARDDESTRDLMLDGFETLGDRQCSVTPCG